MLQHEEATAAIVGIAVPYGESTTLANGTRERIVRRAFARSLLAGDVELCIDHQRWYIVARTSDGTLRLFEDPCGLRFEIYTWAAAALRERVRRGGFRGASVSIRVRCARQIDQVRTVSDADLVEISLMAVLVPTYPSTWVAVDSEATRARITIANRAAVEAEIATAEGICR
jgi:HK97 family phage prohead protease